MKILVTVKESDYLTDEFKIKNGKVEKKYFDHQFDRSDEYGLEEAKRISEEHKDVEIVSVTIGPFRSMDTVRMAIARGADRGLRIWDDKLNEFEFLSHHIKSEILGKIVEREEPDLVFTGVQSEDVSFCSTGGLLAKKVDYALSTIVTDLDVDIENRLAITHRELEGGKKEIREVKFPAVITMQAGINEPAYVSIRNLYRQKGEANTETYDFDDLNFGSINLENRLTLTEITKLERNVKFLGNEPSRSAGSLKSILQEEGVI